MKFESLEQFIKKIIFFDDFVIQKLISKVYANEGDSIDLTEYGLTKIKVSKVVDAFFQATKDHVITYNDTRNKGNIQLVSIRKVKGVPKFSQAKNMEMLRTFLITYCSQYRREREKFPVVSNELEVIDGAYKISLLDKMGYRVAYMEVK